MATITPEMVRIGSKVRRLRKDRVWTQQDLADAAGVGITSIVRIELNQVEPHVTTIRRLAKALDIEPSELVR